MGRPQPCNCRCSPQNVYCDYIHGLIPSTNYTHFHNLMNPTVMQPNSLSDLDDCNLYLLACFGRPRRSGSSYAGMYLTPTQLGILADWVVLGGKVMFAIEYDTLTVSGTVIGRECDAAYLALMNAFLSDCGSSLSCAPHSITSSVPGWSTSTFNTGYPLTSGVTGNVYYDNGDAGGDLTGGTTIFNPNTHMVIAYDEPTGGGLVVGSGSQNILWCNSSVSEASNAAMLEFQQRVLDL